MRCNVGFWVYAASTISWGGLCVWQAVDGHGMFAGLTFMVAAASALGAWVHGRAD